jgi:TonB family protein
MSEPPTDSSVLLPQEQGEGWSRNKLLFFIGFALAVHVALISIFETKKQIVPRAVIGVPHLQLADNASELIALGDPTLFARPNAHDFVTAFWQRPPLVKLPVFNYAEDPRYLSPAPEELGAVFREFMQTNRTPEAPVNFKPKPRLSEPVLAFDNALPPATTLQMAGELAGRRLLSQIELPSVAVNDVIPPSKVQALVDPAGNVASAILLESSTFDAADQRALQLARNLRFAPAPRLMFGEIIFSWHTVPTNAP